MQYAASLSVGESRSQDPLGTAEPDSVRASRSPKLVASRELCSRTQSAVVPPPLTHERYGSQIGWKL